LKSFNNSYHQPEIWRNCEESKKVTPTDQTGDTALVWATLMFEFLCLLAECINQQKTIPDFRDVRGQALATYK